MLALLIPYAVVVVGASGPDQGCPSARQVSDALAARAPGLSSVGAPAQAITPGTFRLTVNAGAAGGPVRVEMTDATGEVRLRRLLVPGTKGRASECGALADTVALIVERYLNELGYEEPPWMPEIAEPAALTDVKAPPPAAPVPPRARVLAAIGGDWRSTQAAGSDPEVHLRVAVESARRAVRRGASFEVGFTRASEGSWTTQAPDSTLESHSATLIRVPLRVMGYLGFTMGPGVVEPALGLALDWLSVEARHPESAQRFNHFSPYVDGTFAYRVSRGRLFLRGAASFGINLLTYDFRIDPDQAPPTDVVFASPRTYAKFGIELGFAFR